MPIESMSKYTGDATLRSPRECLEDCIKDIEQEKGAFMNGKKLLVLCLDDQDGNYCISFSQAGMTMSQCLTLAETSKSIFLREMKYNLFPDDVGL